MTATEWCEVALFAGVGGFSLAARRNGVRSVVAVEIDSDARAVYRRNFPDAVILHDVKDVSGDDLRDAGCAPERTIFSGGYPCQPFSVAGGRGGLADPRGTLFGEIIRLAHEFHPAWMILENVPGLMSIEDGNTLRDMLDLLLDAGYVVDVNEFDSQDFGVPQRRKRIYFACHRADLALGRRSPYSALLTTHLLAEAMACSLARHRRSSPAGMSAGAPAWLSPEGLATRTTLLAHCGPDWVARALSSARSLPIADDFDHALPVALGDLASAADASTMAIFAQFLLAAGAAVAEMTARPPNRAHAAACVADVLEEFTRYAEHESRSILGDLDWSYDWDAFCAQAEGLCVTLRRAGESDGPGPVEVLAEPEGGGRGAAPRQSPRSLAAAGAGAGVGGSGGTGGGASSER